jgi:hypothetical protein
MSKKLVFFLAILGLVGILFPRQPGSVSLMGNFLLTPDQGIKGTYGNGIIYPEIRYNSGSLIYNEFYFWMGMGFLYLKSDTSNAAGTDKLLQYHYSLGFGYKREFYPNWFINLRIGGLGMIFKDEALNMEKEKAAFGASGSAALVLDWGKRFYSEMEAGYSFVSGKTDDGTTVKPGGLKFSIGLGIKF